ncbi:MAG TPA: hypothetical protein VH300_08175 [Thermoleophilaceae bacterium]|nr:hypothetical protein [Thermoleophilaceae bacterium]
MSTFDYILGVSALALLLFNMRRHELTDRRLRRPVIIAGVICVAFLHSVPTAGADGLLVGACLLIGAACGAVSATATRVEGDRETGVVIAEATPLAMAVTGVAFAARMGFAVAATHGLGPAIARFSTEIGVHSAAAWVAALVLMAATDLVVRAAILWRRRAAARAGREWVALPRTA